MLHSSSRDKIPVFLALLFISIFIHIPAQAEKRYIGDTLIVTLREGPGKSYRVIKSLKTGAELTVLDQQNNFIKVKTVDGQQGWLAKQYTNTSPPKIVIIKELQEQVKRLTAANEKLTHKSTALAASLSEQNQELVNMQKGLSSQTTAAQSELSRVTEELDRVTKKYALLMSKSKEVIQVREERDRLKKEFAPLQLSVVRLEAENIARADQHKIYWFLAGGGVFISGWLIGRMSLRRQKRSSITF